MQWDDGNVGFGSTAFGQNATASGASSFAFGYTTAAIGAVGTAFGQFTTASGDYSTAFGSRNTAPTYSETVLGIGATIYTPSANGATQFRVANATDRLLVVGNAIDANNNSTVDTAERSDALVILKNGNTGIGSSTPQDKLHVVGNIRMVDGNQAAGKVMTSDTNGTASWTTAGTIASGTLDQAYDFGGAGLGKTITADTGAVTIAGTDGLVATGTFGSGAIVPSGAGTRMVWNPSKAAFRAGEVFGSQWDDLNIGTHSTAFGYSTIASGSGSTAFGNQSRATGSGSTAFGTFNSALGVNSTAFGRQTFANGELSTSLGFVNVASGDCSIAAGYLNTASSCGETVVGIAATSYTPSAYGATQFTLANATDRLFVVGNGYDANSSGIIRTLVILKNGDTGIGTSTPKTRLEIIDSNIITAPTTRGNLNVMTNDAQAINVGGSMSLGGNIGVGFQSVFGTIEGRKTNATTNVSSGYLIFKTNNGTVLNERLRITEAGDVGIGLNNPGGQFQLSLDEGRKPGTNTWTIASDERLKIIHGNYTKGLEEILKLQPIRYNYINTGTRTFEEKVLQTEYSGFSAQEVQKVFPQAVGFDEDGFLNFNMHPILVAFVNGFKELDTKNKALQIQNEALKDELKSLEQKVEAILSEVEKLKK